MEMLYMFRACSPIVRSVIIPTQKHRYSVMREKQLSDVYAYLCVCVCTVRVPACVRSTVVGGYIFSCFHIFPLNPLCISYVFHTCHVFLRSHSFLYDPPKKIWWEVQNMKLLTSLLDCLCFRPTKISFKIRVLVKYFLTVSLSKERRW
jgi:hypothetical protein